MAVRITAGAGLFTDRSFRPYLAARVVSQLGDQMYVFAVGWYAMDLTRAGFHLALLLAVNALVVMVISPLGGLVSDRVNRRTVMVVTDLIQGVVLLALLALWRGRPEIAGLYVATVILGLCGAVFSPAANAVLPGVVGRDRVPAAVAAGQAASNLCVVAGMLAGGLLYRLIGLSGILALNAGTNLLAAAMESRIPINTGGTAPGARVSAASGAGSVGRALRRFALELEDGLRQVRTDRPVLAYLLINTVFAFVVLPIPMVYLPYFFNVVLGAAPLPAAIAQIGSWAGVLVGSVVAARALRRRPGEAIVAGGLLCISATTFLFVVILWARRLLGTVALSIICALANVSAGISGAFFVVPLYALFHARAKEEHRGRFWGLEGSLHTAATCCGYLAAGTIAGPLSLEAVFAGTATLMLLMFFWALRLRSAAATTASREVPAAPPAMTRG